MAQIRCGFGDRIASSSGALSIAYKAKWIGLCFLIIAKTIKFMKMYKKPITEVAAFNTEHLMDSVTVSLGGGNGSGSNDAPRRRGDVIE